MSYRKGLHRDQHDSPVFFGEQIAPVPEVSSYEGDPIGGNPKPTVPLTFSLISPLAADGSPDLIQFTREEFFEELLKLRDDERDRIGHELHDSTGQLLLYLQLSAARLRILEGADEHHDLIDEIQATARQIAAEIRSLAFINHPLTMPATGLTAALRALIEGLGKRTGYRVSFKGPETTRADEMSSLALLRIAQEALVNVHRHAHASSVTMKLRESGGVLELTITDNGIGMPSVAERAFRGGVGVEGMRFRAQQLGGSLNVASSKRGTKIVAQIPLMRLGGPKEG